MDEAVTVLYSPDNPLQSWLYPFRTVRLPPHAFLQHR